MQKRAKWLLSCCAMSGYPFQNSVSTSTRSSSAADSDSAR